MINIFLKYGVLNSQEYKTFNLSLRKVSLETSNIQSGIMTVSHIPDLEHSQQCNDCFPRTRLLIYSAV